MFHITPAFSMCPETAVVIVEAGVDDEDAGELDPRTTPNFFLSGVEGRGNDGLKAITRGPS